MKDVLNIIKSSFDKYDLDTVVDVRITMSKNGIKVNMGLGFSSNKPTTFNLIDAVIDSCELSLESINDILITYNNDPSTRSEYDKKTRIPRCMRNKEILEEIITELKKP